MAKLRRFLQNDLVLYVDHAHSSTDLHFLESWKTTQLGKIVGSVVLTTATLQDAQLSTTIMERLRENPNNCC
jgi:hypothetical protein